MQKIRFVVLSLCLTSSLLLGSATCANAAEEVQVARDEKAAGTAGAKLFAGVRQRILREMEKSDAPSAAVAVARDGKIVWEEAFGWADVERKIPATVDTMYSLASVSKPMTATGLMVLAERGKLDLDAPVNRYLAADSQIKVWIGDPEKVTLRRMASHTAGLPRHEHFYRNGEIASMPTMEESIRRYGNIVTPPGERYRYSNFGYGILDHVIARTSGMSFADFMRREVFLPLGMTHTSVDIDPALAEFASIRYRPGNRPIRFYSSDHAGASNIWSSVHDLVRFGMFHLGQADRDEKALLSNESLAAMKVPEASMNGANPADVNLREGSCYGIGWVLREDAFGLRINHVGGMAGAKAQLVILPEQGIVVAVVTNKFCPLPERISEAVLAAMIPDYSARMSEHWRKLRQTSPRTSPPEFKVTPELQSDWEGFLHTYAGAFPMTLSFEESGEVWARLGEQKRTRVTNLTFVDGKLTGSMAGRIGTPDALRRRQQPLHLDVKLRGDAINGAIVATIGDALSHWVELRKK